MRRIILSRLICIYIVSHSNDAKPRANTFRIIVDPDETDHIEPLICIYIVSHSNDELFLTFLIPKRTIFAHNQRKKKSNKKVKRYKPLESNFNPMIIRQPKTASRLPVHLPYKHYMPPSCQHFRYSPMTIISAIYLTGRQSVTHKSKHIGFILNWEENPCKNSFSPFVSY